MAPISDEAFAALLRERSVAVTRILDAEQALTALGDAGDAVKGPLLSVRDQLTEDAEPLRLHYEREAALRNLVDKETQLATYQSGERPMFRYASQGEMLQSVRDNPVSAAEVRNAQEQVDAAKAAVEEWEKLIAAHPVAASLKVAEPTSALTPH